jgi:hypothetical protein
MRFITLLLLGVVASLTPVNYGQDSSVGRLPPGFKGLTSKPARAGDGRHLTTAPSDAYVHYSQYLPILYDLDPQSEGFAVATYRFQRLAEKHRMDEVVEAILDFEPTLSLPRPGNAARSEHVLNSLIRFPQDSSTRQVDRALCRIVSTRDLSDTASKRARAWLNLSDPVSEGGMGLRDNQAIVYFVVSAERKVPGHVAYFLFCDAPTYAGQRLPYVGAGVVRPATDARSRELEWMFHIFEHGRWRIKNRYVIDNQREFDRQVRRMAEAPEWEVRAYLAGVLRREKGLRARFPALVDKLRADQVKVVSDLMKKEPWDGFP